MLRAGDCRSELLAGKADLVIHSGGDGEPVAEDMKDVPKLYICHSHQWKARKEGGEIVRLKGVVKGVRTINVFEENEILGRKGPMSIMEYHTLAVVRPPRDARVLATSRVQDAQGKELEIIEALEYPDGSFSIQGHPEEGKAEHVIYNFLKKRVDKIKRGVL